MALVQLGAGRCGDKTDVLLINFRTYAFCAVFVFEFNGQSGQYAANDAGCAETYRPIVAILHKLIFADGDALAIHAVDDFQTVIALFKAEVGAIRLNDEPRLLALWYDIMVCHLYPNFMYGLIRASTPYRVA